MSDKQAEKEIKIIVAGDSQNEETILNTYKNKIVGDDHVRTVYVLLFISSKIKCSHFKYIKYIISDTILWLCLVGLTHIP